MIEPTDSFINMSLGRYEVQERIGVGGMARVFKGYDKNLDRTVAIKILHEHYSFEATFKERFEREAKLIAGLNHPNIVQVYDFDAITRNDSQHYYMVMSYIQGVTLRDVIQKHTERETPIPHEQVLQIMLDMTSALGFAHQQGMIHRDVKPANILIDESGKAVLTDFGIARFAEGSNLTKEGLTVGTPTYMSPEQATGVAVDNRSDLYSLGIILYELLAGNTPFSDDGSLSVLIKHIQEDIPSLNIHTHMDNIYLDHIIYKALAKLPEDRYQSAEEFASDLKQAFTGEVPQQAKNFIAPKPAEKIIHISKAKQIDDSATQVVNVNPSNNKKQPSHHKRHNSPLAILLVGVFAITLLLAIYLLNNSGNNTTTNDTQNITQDTSESMTGSLYFTTNFSDEFGEYWAIGEQETITRSINANGQYNLSSEQGNRAFATVFEIDSNYTNHIISITATLDETSSSTSGYGIIFRYVDEDNYNVFAVDGMGRFSIWLRENGEWHELRNTDETWTTHPIINIKNMTNTLIIRIEGDELIGMVNDEIVTTVTDDTISSGNIGIYMATPPSGIASVTIDSYSVTEITSESVESMTGN